MSAETKLKWIKVVAFTHYDYIDEWVEAFHNQMIYRIITDQFTSVEQIMAELEEYDEIINMDELNRILNEE